MNQKECLNIVVKALSNEIVKCDEDFKNYDYSNHKCEYAIKRIFEYIKNSGLEISNPYHAHGIGNNNEYRIFLKEIDSDGFVIEKNVAKLHITYGIYGGVSMWAEDYNTGKEIIGIHYVR